MISRLVELEQARFKAMGFESIVTPVTLTVSKGLVNECIGNDTYILTGIRVSDTDIVSSRHNVCISSATDAIEGSQREIAALGQAIFRLMKNFIVVKTNDHEGWTADKNVSPYILDFMKITPLKSD